MPKGDIETFHEGGKWHNAVDGDVTRDATSHDTKEDAVKVGREMARKAKVEHIIRNRDGNIAQQHSYGDGAEELHQNDQGKPPFAKAYSFALVTGAFFLFSWAGQLWTQVMVERNEARQHGGSFHWSEFWPQFFASTFENWQSEFLQLVWQAVGLALLLFWGSSQSKESDERIEAKLDALLDDRGIDHRAINEETNASL